jgi:hypothetical protein
MRRMTLTWVVVAYVALSAGCAAIPAEAPELSGQLGVRVTAIEASHQRLVEQFFAEKRRRVDEYVQQVWVPEFAKQFFEDPPMDALWKEVVNSPDLGDRLKFISRAAPVLQEKINAKRVELIQPLEELEAQVKSKLRTEYDQVRSINSTLTAFLQSAAKVEANRKRYLEMLGIADKQVDKFIDDTDSAVSSLTAKAGGVQEKVDAAKSFIDRVKSIIGKVKG